MAKILVVGLVTGISSLCLPLSAVADGEVARLRIGKNPEFSRLVFDLGTAPVEASQSLNSAEFVLTLSSPKPILSLAVEDQLADLGAYFESTGSGSRVVVERRGRNVRVFRLEAALGSGKGDRLVLDIGPRGGRPLTIPPDAAIVPETRSEMDVASSRRSDPPPRRVESTPSPPRREPERVSRAPRREPDPPPAREPDPTPEVGARPAASELPDAGEAPDVGQEEDVWVLVRSIDFEGVRTEPSVDELQSLKLAVSPVRGGYVAPRADLPVQRVPLSALTGDDRNGRKLSGSVLQLIVETIAQAYTRNDKLGTQVDISRPTLESLRKPDSDGRLLIRVREKPRSESRS